MIKSFNCPSCGAPLEHNSGPEPMAKCYFCGSLSAVPHELRAPKIQPPHVGGQEPARKSTAQIIFVLMLALSAVGLIAYKASVGTDKATVIAKPTPQAVRQPASNAPTNAQDFATLVLTFGSEGIGPGMFTDARSVAVDAEGRIYVGEYSGGRVQVFDQTGRFITQWMADRKMPLRGLASDRNGTVYVVQRGVISRYEGPTGKELGQLQYGGGWGFDDIAVAADGGIVAAWYKNRDDIVRFDSTGKTVRAIRSAISGQTERSELQTRVAIDGMENIYALGTFNNAVFKFSPEGKYINMFGGEGRERGSLHAPSAIAVDGKGRVYVSDFGGVQVFDSNGRFIDSIDVQGAASGLAFNDMDQLLVAARSKVYKYVINK